MGDLEDAIYLTWNMFHGYLANALNMFPKEVNATNGKAMADMEEIEKLRYNEEDHVEMEKKIENENQMGISCGNTENQLGGRKKNWNRRAKLGEGNWQIAEALAKA